MQCVMMDLPESCLHEKIVENDWAFSSYNLGILLKC